MLFRLDKLTLMFAASLVLTTVQPREASAQSSEQLSAITALGSLNGIALHCQALSETQRIKRTLVATLPKRRQLGELFDYETNRSFMAFIEKNNTCPTPQSLEQRIDEALDRLKSLYPAK
ncbi:MAG: hypothetical protein AB2791_15855 [Candidatus Thiodiazotropha endolucinida]